MGERRRGPQGARTGALWAFLRSATLARAAPNPNERHHMPTINYRDIHSPDQLAEALAAVYGRCKVAKPHVQGLPFGAMTLTVTDVHEGSEFTIHCTADGRVINTRPR